MATIKSTKIKYGMVLLAVISVISIFCFFYATYYKYNDSWIIGKHYSEITEKYGEFDLDFGSTAGYKINESFTDYIWRYFMGGQPIEYYFIKFNENKIAQEVYKGSYPGY